MVQQEPADQVVVPAVALLPGVEGPEGRGHQRRLLQGVEGVHGRPVGEVERRQLWDPKSGCRVQRRVLAVVLSGRVHV